MAWTVTISSLSVGLPLLPRITGILMSAADSVDWDQVRTVLRRTLSSKMDRHEEGLLDDLVQEGSIRFLRAARRSDIEDETGLAITIATRTWLDYLRRISRHRQTFTALDEEQAQNIGDPSSLRDPLLGDLRERIGLVLQEVLDRSGGDECRQLAQAFLARLDWKTVAESMDIGYSAVRKRWSRCLSTLRREISTDPEWSALLGEG